MEPRQEDRQHPSQLQEIEFSRQLLHSILPENLPVSDSFQVGILFRPRSRFCVDFYDCIRGRKGMVFFMTGSASQQSLAGVLYMATARGILWTLAKNDVDITTVANNGSHFILENWQSPSPMVLHSLLFCLYPLEGSVDFINASGPPLIIVKGSGAVELHEGQEAPLGAFRNIRYRKSTVAVAPPDIVAGCTGGIFAITDGQGNHYTIERLVEVLKRVRHLDAQGIIAQVEQDLHDFTEPSSIREDITLTVVKLTAEPI